jgi:hypothetical protein
MCSWPHREMVVVHIYVRIYKYNWPRGDKMADLQQRKHVVVLVAGVALKQHTNVTQYSGYRSSRQRHWDIVSGTVPKSKEKYHIALCYKARLYGAPCVGTGTIRPRTFHSRTIYPQTLYPGVFTFPYVSSIHGLGEFCWLLLFQG